MIHVVQDKVRGNVGAEGWIQQWKKIAEKREDEIKKKEDVVKKLEKKREQYEGELWVVLWNSVRLVNSEVMCIAVMVSIATCSVGIICIVIRIAVFEWMVYQLQLEPPDYISSTTHMFILLVLMFIEMSMNEERPLLLSPTLSKFMKYIYSYVY